MRFDLNGLLHEEVYMVQPSGFEASDKSLVCKLNKALYGLKQAPRAWFERLKTTLVKQGFQSSKCDPSLFLFQQQGIRIVFLVYVGDIIVTGNSSTLIQALIEQLNGEFALKQLGSLDCFLGIEVSHLPNGSLLLNQSKYIRDLLAKVHMEAAKPIPTPMVSNAKLSKEGSNYVEDPSLYRSIVGALQYATLTRPKISFSVNKVCQFLSQSLEEHW